LPPGRPLGMSYMRIMPTKESGCLGKQFIRNILRLELLKDFGSNLSRYGGTTPAGRFPLQTAWEKWPFFVGEASGQTVGAVFSAARRIRPRT